MIDLINGLQIGTAPQELGKLTQGTAVDQKVDADAFQNLLQQMQEAGINDQQAVKNLLSQNDDLKSFIQGHGVQNPETLFSKLFSSDQSDEVVTSEQLLKAKNDISNSNPTITKPEAQGSNLGDILNSKFSSEVQPTPQTQSLEQPVTTKQAKGLPQGLQNILGKSAVNNTEAMSQSQMSMMSKAQESLEAVDPRLGSGQLKIGATVQKPTVTTKQMHFSEDFVAAHTTGLADKPRVVGKRNAISSFSAEKAVLDDSGIIKKKSIGHIDKENTLFDTAAKEKLTSQVDNAQVMNREVLEVNPMTQKTETTSSITASVQGGQDVKVLDLSNVDNPQKIMDEISKYIENSRIQNGKELNIVVKHNDLGQFRVHAQKAQGGMIDLQIHTASDEAHNFFQKHEVGLLKTLSSQGVRIADFKLAQSDSSSMASSGNDSSGQNFSGNEQGFARKFNGGQDFQDGRQRRQELWDEYRERLGA
jgi:hypothetical protein